MPPYTTDKAAAETLLPPGFEWMASPYTAGWIYEPYRRCGLDDAKFNFSALQGSLRTGTELAGGRPTGHRSEEAVAISGIFAPNAP